MPPTRIDTGAPGGADKDDDTDELKGKAGADREEDLDQEDLDDDGQGGELDAEELTLEELAVEAGWKPLDKWKGDPSKHVGPGEYLRRLTASQKNLAKKAAERDGQGRDLKKRIDGLEQTTREGRMREINDIKDHYDRLLDRAIESGDKARIRKARDERDEAIDKLNEEAVKLAPRQQTEDEFIAEMAERLETAPISKVQSPFFRENDWLLDTDDDEAVQAFGDIDEIVNEILASASVRADGKRRAPTHEDYEKAFAAAERHLRKNYPDRFAPDDGDEEDDEVDTGERNRRGQFQKSERSQAREDGGQRRRGPVLAPGNRGRTRDVEGRVPQEAWKNLDKDIKSGLFADRKEAATAYLKELGEKFD